MGRSLLFGAVLCGILLVAATTRSDVISSRAPWSTTRHRSRNRFEEER